MAATEGTEEESSSEKMGDIADGHGLNLAAFIKNNGLSRGCHCGGQMYGADEELPMKLTRATRLNGTARLGLGQQHKSTHPVLRSRTSNNSNVSVRRKRRHSSCRDCDHDESLDSVGNSYGSSSSGTDLSNSSDDVSIMPDDYADVDAHAPYKQSRSPVCADAGAPYKQSRGAVAADSRGAYILGQTRVLPLALAGMAATTGQGHEAPGGNCMGATCCRDSKPLESKSEKPKNGFAEPGGVLRGFLKPKSHAARPPRNGVVTKDQQGVLLALGKDIGRSCQVALPRCERAADRASSPEEASSPVPDEKRPRGRPPDSPVGSVETSGGRTDDVGGSTGQPSPSPSDEIAVTTTLESIDKVVSWTVCNELGAAAASVAPPGSVVCGWEGCAMAAMECDAQLMEHVHRAHVEPQRGSDTFACRWLGCKVYAQPSCSRSWLGLHVRSHLGSRPFKCIVAGCGQRFTSEVALERHVNRHFVPAPAASPRTLRSRDDTPSKLLRRKKTQKLRRRNRQLKTEDYFDSCIMERLQSHLVDTNVTHGYVGHQLGRSLTFHGIVICRRREASGKVFALQRWSPPHILPDSWVPESQIATTKTVPLCKLPPGPLGSMLPPEQRGA
ncbi:PREDICTED: zinc finger protein aebp2-like, partial [Priapulus caudatus]|uniref:Zinc finger protein aebp2-like n=1 Tax=Priapulus caudatus TaxID=37621 RepID=A0ABM1DW53_PRICU